MDENSSNVKIAPDEKAVSVMVYTQNYLCWGKVILKEQVRASTWLRGNLAPEFIRLLDARLLITTSPTDRIHPLAFSEMHVPVQSVVAFHITPPAKDPLDFDPSEPNRQMVPISIMVGSFKFDGCMRMAVQSTLQKYMEITREVYTSVYDVAVQSSLLPTFGVVHVPHLLVRKDNVIFSSQ